MTIPLITPLRWPAEAIWQAVAPALPSFTVEILPEIDSSNSELMRRFRGATGLSSRPEPTLLVAEQQTAGRGRLGRNWQSQRGDSLTFSLGLMLQPADLSGLSLVIGISLAESLDPSFGRLASSKAHIGLKWPNDLWLTDAAGERKLAGILVETVSLDGQRYVVIGVGINIRTVALTEPTSVPPAGLQELAPHMDAAQTLLCVVPPLVQAIQAFEQFGFTPFQARFAKRDVLLGRAVQLSDGTQGEAHGVAENGALRVYTSAGMQEMTSSEISVRPVAATANAAPASVRPC